MNTANSNPYIGPRPFKKNEARRFFGREREARELLALVSSQRLVLFYASSGAGKSSLIEARLIHALAGRQFEVLPTGRISGVMPLEAGANLAATNVFCYFLKQSLAEHLPDMALTEASERFFQAYVDSSLSEFLLRLSLAGKDDAGNDSYVFTMPESTVEISPPALSEDAGIELRPRVLIIDQFEEIFTTSLQAWEQRSDFFAQLRQAMEDDPYLWVVITMREDFIANLDPYAHLLPGGLHARYYMQRMDYSPALEAVRKPVEVEDPEHPEWRRPFAADVAEKLVDNLRQVHISAERGEGGLTATGQFIEPVQLQVVCYQLWEQLRDTPGTQITDADLDRLAGGQDLSVFIDRALAEFYEQALRHVLEQAGSAVSEMELRRWFSERLITEAGTRGFVYRGESETGGLPNEVVRLIAAEFLIRSEARAGGTWYELSHDRFVDPIQRSNQRWSMEQLQRDPLLRRAHEWADSHADPDQRDRSWLLDDDELASLDLNSPSTDAVMHEFVEASRHEKQKRDLKTAHDREEEAKHQLEEANRREEKEKRISRQLRRQRIGLVMLTGLTVVLLIGVGVLAFRLSKTNGELITANGELDTANTKLETANEDLTTERNNLQISNDNLITKTNELELARNELQSVTLSRIVSRLDLTSEDQRQFALLLSQEAMAIAPTLQAESASIEALNVAYRRQAGWQPLITPTVYFTQAMALPFSNPLTMTLRRDGEAVAAVIGGTDVVVALNPSEWVTRPVTTSFATVGALALSDDGKYIAVAGCGQKPTTKTPNNPKQSPQNSPDAPQVNSGCSNWRLEVMPVADDSHFHRTVPLTNTFGGVKALAFHPFLLQLVAATSDGSLLHWHLSASKPTPQSVATSKLKNLIDLTVSPDGMYLEALDVHGLNRVWTWATWNGRDNDLPQDLKANSYRGASFVRDGSWLATVSNCPNNPGDQEYHDPCPVLRLWQRGTQAPIGGPILVGDNITDVGFDEFSDTLTTVGRRGLIRWNLNRDDWEELVCQRVDRTLTYDEWKEAFPNDDLTTYQGACSKPIHASFVIAQIADAAKKLDDCSPQGTDAGWKMLDYGDIPRLQAAVTILFEQALDRFELKQTGLNNPAAACLQEANTLLADGGKDEIPLETAMETARRLLDGESKMRNDPEFSVAERGAVQAQLAQWSINLDNRLATDYLTLCFDQGFLDACDVVQGGSAKTLIAPGETQTGEILQGTEGTPWYFVGQQGREVSIAMNAVGDGFDTFLSLDGSGGRSELAYDDDSGDNYNSLIENFVLPENGMYRIRPQTLSGSGAYRLTLTARDLPRLEFGISAPATSAAEGPWIFDGKAGQIVTLDMEISGDGFDPYLTLQRAGESIEENSRDGRIDPVTLTADDLYVVTADLGYGSGAYSITLNLLEPLTLTIDQPEVSTTEANEIWAFEGAAGQIVNITLASSDPDQFNPDVDLRDSLGGVSTDSSGDRTTARIRNAILPKAGTYYVRTGPGHNSTPYTLTVSMGSSPTLTPGVTKEATSDEATLWSIDGQAGQIISASVVADVAFTDLKLSLLASRGESLMSVSADWETGSARIPNYVLRTDGPKYLRVDGLDGQATYQLRVEQIEPAELTTGPSVTSTTDGATFWTLAAEPGQIVQISLNATDDSGLDPILRLFDADGQQIGYNDDGGEGLNSLLTTVLPGSSSYLVQADNYGGSGAFKLAVDVLTPESLPLDNASATVLPNRVWSVEGKPGQVLTVDITDTGDFSYPYLQLVASDGVVLASNEGSGSMTALLSRAGAYYILPRSVADSGEDTITARLSDATAAPNLNEIASQTLTNLASNNAIDQALALYAWGTTDGGVAFTASGRNALCWFGALRGAAQQVITICDDLVQNAGTSDPYDLGKYRDSRGVALALTGNNDGAADDFEYYADNDGYYGSQRREWAQRLRDGAPVADVLDEATLQELLWQ